MIGALAVAVGGACGALLRYFAGLWLNRADFPYGTLAVNLVGSFLIGFLVLYAAKQKWAEPTTLFAVTGVLGGFTTFSAFSFENLEMVQDGKLGMAFGYAVGTVVLGLALAWCGFALAQKITG